MDNFRLNDVEAIRIMHAAGNLRVRGVTSGDTLLECNSEPQIRRVENRAEILIPSNATLEVAPGVVLEVLECAGNLDVEDISAPLSLGRVRGNLRARRIGAIAIRGEVAGNMSLDDVAAIEGEQVNGNLRIEGARSVKFRNVAGNVECGTVEGEVIFDEVRGRLRVSVAGAVSARRVAGKLEVQGVASLHAENVSSKVKAIEVAGDVALGKVGGRLSCDDIAGNVSAQEVDGHVGLRGIRGAVALPKIGGAADLLGPLPGAGIWKIVSRGRISVEIAPETSAKFTASARHGRVRLYGVAEDSFARTERGLVEGTLGAGGLDLSLEASDADIILFADDAQSRDYDGRRRSSEFRFGRRFAAPFENFAQNFTEDLREDIPEFVGEILGAAGRIVSESGKFTGSIAHDVTRSVGDALREVERTISDLDDKVPHEVSDKLTRLGRRISDAVERAVDEARERRRERAHRRDDSETETRPSEAASSEEPPAPGAEGTRDAAMMKILNAVREGTLKPEEADKLIAAWAELHRSSDASHSE
jgi:DUF4097 and DUF4098 domain-containing protein YvlB